MRSPRPLYTNDLTKQREERSGFLLLLLVLTVIVIATVYHA